MWIPSVLTFFWIKVEETFLNLFIGGNRVIVCSESSFVRSDVYFVVQDSPILFQWSVTALFQYTFVETFTAKLNFVRGDVIATVFLTTQTKHFRTSELFFEEDRLSLIWLFVYYTTSSGEEIRYSISIENVDTVVRSQSLPFNSHFRSYTVFQIFLGKSKIQRICVHFQLFELVYITESGEEVLVQLQFLHLCVMKNEEPDNDWLFVFNLCYGEFNFIQWIVHMI